MIEIKNVSKSFGDKEVLKNVNITIKDGSVLGLIGINGAGKSTLLRIISGVYEMDEGFVYFDGVSAKFNKGIKKDLFFLPDEPYYTIYDTPLTITKIYREFYNFNEEVYLNYLKMFNIPLEKTMNNFSKGMKRQVFIALAIAIAPKYLLLDEAFDGLDPIARLSFKKAIIELIEKNNTTIVISSHSLRELEDICDCYALLDNKKIAVSGDLIDHLSTYHKYNIAFKNEVSQSDFDFEIIDYEQDKRIITIIVEYDLEELKKRISHLEPLIIDEIRIDFEELFILEVQKRGYVK